MGIIRSGEPDRRADEAGQGHSGAPGLGAGVKVCQVCAAEYLAWATKCASCGVALVEPEDSPYERLVRGDITVADLDEDDQVIYELGGYTLAQRTDLAALLAEAGVPHTWDGEDLMVHVIDEEAVDDLCAQVEGEPLPPDPVAVAARTEALADPATPAVSYELDEWLDDERERLSELFAGRGVAHLWDGTTLVVHADDEDAADELMDRIEYPDAIAADDADGDDGGAGAELLSELFIAADVLQGDPTDTDAWQRLGEVLDNAHPDQAPYGVDAAVWRDVMTQGEELEALLDDDDLDDEQVRERAVALRARLRPLV